MSELVTRTLAELTRLVDEGEASCREVVQAFLDRAADVDDRVCAFVSLRRQEALREAEQADQARRRGGSRGPLHGLQGRRDAGGCTEAMARGRAGGAWYLAHR